MNRSYQVIQSIMNIGFMLCLTTVLNHYGFTFRMGVFWAIYSSVSWVFWMLSRLYLMSFDDHAK